PASRAEAAGPPVRPDAPPPGSPVSRPPSPPSSRWPDVRSTAGLLAAAVIFLTIAAFAVNEFGMNRPPNPPHQEGRPSGKAARARPGEVDLDRYGLHFTVPYGWEVHEQVQKTDHAWCELRKRSRGRVESVIWIWSGGKIIDEAPGYSGIQKGSRLASLVWA